MPAAVRRLLGPAVLSLLSAAGGSAATLATVQLTAPPPSASERWQRGFRFGYEAGLHDARGPGANTWVPALGTAAAPARP